MNKKIIILAFAVILCLVCAESAVAHDVNTAEIDNGSTTSYYNGTVCRTDKIAGFVFIHVYDVNTNEPIQDATVRVNLEGSQATDEAISDEDGSCWFWVMPCCTYEGAVTYFGDDGFKIECFEIPWYSSSVDVYI